MPDRARRRLLLLVAGMLAVGAVAAAPGHVQRELVHAYLKGQGSYRWLGFSVYQASLWTRGDTDEPDRMAAPFALDLRYARAFSGEQIAQASIDQMERIGRVPAGRRTEWFERMRSLFPDVQEGTHLTGVYLPGDGARFYHDGRLLGEVADPAFARSFFSIWLDEKTSEPALRARLLGRVTR